ncbi:unnamed protein product [Victoria cruziana]
MNIFRLAGDMTHLISVLVLLLKIYATKSCAGISLKTHELYVLVFITRYVDLFTDFISLYNTVMKVFWAFSIYLEAVAIFPQLVLLQRSGNVDNLTGQYIFFLGAYRAFYCVNWIYRYLMEKHYVRWISSISGFVQTALYADFFYYYFVSWKHNAKLQLPS